MAANLFARNATYTVMQLNTGPERERECRHTWVRLKDFEQSLEVVVFVRRCVICGCVQAKDGHKNPATEPGWGVISDGSVAPFPGGDD